jgi:acyl-CoA synthetase (AMP-forming)/AMP-acid ligase II
MTASLRALLEQGARMTPNRRVVDDLTWAQLHVQALRVASALVRDGVGVQERVVYLGKNDARFFAYLFGCALVGAVPTPLNWRLTPDEIAAMVADCRARVVFADPDLTGVVRVPHVVSLGQLEDWLGPAEDPGIPAEPDHVAFQLYTSGTTGRPKGAMFANGTNLRVLLDDVAAEWGFVPGDVSLLAMPLFHMGGLAWALTGMTRGARGVVMRDFEPRAVLDTMERERVTTAFCVPAMLAALCSVAGIDRRALALRQMVYSGSPISAAALTIAMKALRCDFVQIYGMTEATGAFAQLSAAEHDPAHAAVLRSAGRPYPWVEVRVLGQDGIDVPEGEIGEIATRSEQNFVGYWNRSGETAAALTEDGWLHTGDLGHLDDEGRIHLVDRAKDLIITGGENVYPAQVEEVLAAHPDLAEVAVIGVPDERWGETVRAVVVPRAGARIDPAEVIAFARDRLAHFKCPTGVVVAESLPRTATGKVIKAELREPYWRGHDRRIS